MKLPFQRPSPYCRTFTSPKVEQVIHDLTSKIVDKDIARLFENAFPNTLDTTVRWHTNGTDNKSKLSKLGSQAKHQLGLSQDDGKWQGPQSFVVTGDINAEWLRDSTNQLQQYQILAKTDKKIETLILGAINTQAEYVIGSPYCNAFQPPPPSGLSPTYQGDGDEVHPAYEPGFVFECKYELDSLAHFLRLTNEFYAHTGNTEFLTPRWYKALETLLEVLDQQAQPTFNQRGQYTRNQYTFQRRTNAGTETLSLGGVGNPLANGTDLIRSAFRPSDDATILGFFIPANAMMSVEIQRTGDMIMAAIGSKKDLEKTALANDLKNRGERIEKGIWEHAVIHTKRFGDVFAFEIDGYGSSILMDDANLPSLLALPLLGFVEKNNEVYQNTRRMILHKASNPYYLTGPAISGIGGPHIGLQNAWPMSLLVQAMTSDDTKEIKEMLSMVKNTSLLGLVHESVHVGYGRDYTRSWFAWANSVFAQTVLDVAARKPEVLFGEGAKPYIIE